MVSLSLWGVMWTKEHGFTFQKGWKLPRHWNCLLVSVSSSKCLCWSYPFNYCTTAGLLGLPNDYFQKYVSGDALLRKFKTNCFIQLFSCNVKLLKSKHSHEMKFFLLRNKFELNVPGTFHAGMPELKRSKYVWFRSGAHSQRRFNNCPILQLVFFEDSMSENL